MTSVRKIEANRRNAAKSTGPRIEAGKKKVRTNAGKHGLTATTLVVLPHEDEAAYQHRVEAWTAELSPRGEMGRYLAERAAKISWQLDRADAYERACLARRVRRAARQIDEGGDAEAAALLETLYRTPEETWQAGPRQAGPRMSRAFDHPSGNRGEAPAAESPAAPVRKLEATVGGCRRLLGEWDRLREKAVVAPGPDPALSWDWGEMRCAFRLLGLSQHEVKLSAAFDRRLGVLSRAYSEVENRACRKILLMGCDDDPEHDAWTKGTDDDTEPPLPFDVAELNRESRAIAEEQCARLGPLLARHEEGEREERADLPRRMSFDDSAEGERVHRYQAQWGRSLLRTFAAAAGEAARDEPSPEPEVDGESRPTPPGADEAVSPAASSASPQPASVEETPAEVPTGSTAANPRLRNKPTAEETTPEDKGTYIESPGQNKATAAVAGPSLDMHPGATKRPAMV